jgi:aminopeptidase N
MLREFQVAGSGSGMNIEVKDVMDTWTLQMGYPVVTVSRHKNIVNATQERFLFNPRANLTEEFTSPYGCVVSYSE